MFSGLPGHEPIFRRRTKQCVGLVVGIGEYEIGQEATVEFQYRVNVKKRSKKHLRLDFLKNQERKVGIHL
jgi:hypothetical protein